MRENVIKELTDVEHVRHTPGMYVGDAVLGTHNRWSFKDGKLARREIQFVPGILKLFDEIISNSIDEGFRTGFKSPSQKKFTIWVDIEHDGNMITVTDNGRGIPLTPAEGRPNITQAEVALTKLRAGGNFKKKDEKFISIGTHGLGSTLVNILSTHFRAIVSNSEKMLQLNCSRGETLSSMVSPANRPSSTSISFSPDLDLFGVTSLGIHRELIEKRVMDLAACFPEITFKFNSRVVQTRNFSEYVNLIGAPSAVIYEDPTVKLAILPSDEPDQISFTNGIDTYEGGAHVDWFRNRIVDELTDRIRKKLKYKELKPQDVRNKLLIVLMTNSIPNLKFRSQAKEFVTNHPSDFTGIFEKFDPAKIAKRIFEDPEILDPIVETYRLKEQVRQQIELNRTKRKIPKIKVPSYLHASGKDRSRCILFLTEGDSAIGRLDEVRDPSIHGGLPLRGKPMNINGMSLNEIFANKEYKNVSSILGLIPGEPVDWSQLTYGTIGLMADADHDGTSIVGLLINFFSLWPELFEKRVIQIYRSPIVKAERGKEKRVFYTMAEYQKAQDESSLEGMKTTYLKGLGSLSASEYLEMITNPVVEIVTLHDGWKDSLELVFGPDASVRKTWLME